MTPEELQELRDWAAKKMGWEIGIKDYPRPGGSYIYNRGEDVMYLHQWLPDHPESGQIWMLVERMRELEWEYDAWSVLGADKHGFKFWKEVGDGPNKYGEAYDVNPCLAILKAARATEEEE